MTTISLSRDDAVAAVEALRQVGDTATADRIEKLTIQLWVLRSNDEDGYHTYLGRERELAIDYGNGRKLVQRPAGPLQFGSAADAALFTDAEKASFDAAALDADGGVQAEAAQAVVWGQWELAPSDADIADMHENTDPDRVDEYVTLADRAHAMRVEG